MTSARTLCAARWSRRSISARWRRRSTATARCSGERGILSRAPGEGSEQDSAGRTMVEERLDQVPVLVETRRLAHERHDPVSAREIEQRLDVRVAHADGEA